MDGLIRLSIITAALSVLLVAVLIILLFLTALMGAESAPLLSLLFISCMVSLIISLVAFIKEIHLSLFALKLEFGRTPAGMRAVSLVPVHRAIPPKTGHLQPLQVGVT